MNQLARVDQYQLTRVDKNMLASVNQDLLSYDNIKFKAIYLSNIIIHLSNSSYGGVSYY
jgi:hypothetical protein